MSDGFDSSIRVIAATDDLSWEVIPTDAGDPNPPGEELVVFRSEDRTFSFGLWKRVPETGPIEPPYHEIALIIEGTSRSPNRVGPCTGRVRATCSSPRRDRRRRGRRSHR